MKAEIIAVGTEILTGQIVNTNAQFLSEKLAEIGVDVYFQTAVGDNEARLLSLLEIASLRSSLVILTGGLGPTEDDLTKQTLAKFLGKNLVFDPQAQEKLDIFFAHRPDYARTPNNERQAQIVEGATPLPNETGLAVGGVSEVDGVTYVVLPGPPNELKPMVLNQLLPKLMTGAKLYSRVLRFFGIGESQLVTILADLIDQQTDPTLAPYAKTGEVTLRLSTKAVSQEKADQALDILENQILNRQTFEGHSLRDICYGYGEETSLASVVVEELKKRQKSITAAESLTAGLFQATLADFSGVSAVFNGGFVTYSLEEKSKMLDISEQELKEHGVVSEFTARKMAEQARFKTQSDYGVSLTGVAGPDSIEGHPAGTVFIGLAHAKGTEVIKANIAGRSRADVRHIAVMHAFNLVRKALLSD
ncbi:N-terminal domain of CinA protein / C-terminal domain of CinA type S [Streptococcus oralis]|uniref:Putative competence-damage inducible protein n=2 Tax=Streptococcus TaxID=1301 RepID=A0A139Q522_STROR|nr:MULTISPECIES: competence/damage-inducible protein A [Streptococcus]AQA07392.1 competence/damage-inducible CinA C-terminal domain protein [Streptococcus oralis]KXT97655.1 N-terminal domain of CinA protein / C-terminal domain of CinA type S [Streptococcus oralis]MBN6011587.1 competence/damage-inducible protein A [Streptococcus oralis subsp. oralis]MCP9038581.1 competence/damage-inducible protein A [Streptococcus oralis]MCP9053689.1 competence/damage-inducible protein A [Streptococcus oralis]